MSTRITLDRSIFHGENFGRLINSPLLNYCKSSKYSIYHSSILIEETLNLLLKDGEGEVLDKQLKFLIAIGNSRWFRETMDIWNGELQEDSKNDYLYMSRGEQERAKQQLLNRVYLEVKDLDEVSGQKKEIAEKKDNVRNTLVDMRETIAQHLKRNPGVKLSSFDFRSYCNANIDEFGAAVIRKHVKTCKDTNDVIERWKKNKTGYPYFTLSMQAWLYATYYAMAEHNAPIDWNTQMDISLLVVARDLDMVVSNDLKFMKSTFEALYGKTKEYVTLDEFLNRMSGSR